MHVYKLLIAITILVDMNLIAITVQGDPAMVIIPAIDQYRTGYTFAVPEAENAYIGVIVNSQDRSSKALNFFYIYKDIFLYKKILFAPFKFLVIS